MSDMRPRDEAQAVSLRSDVRRDILVLTLDSPGAAVNVLTRDTASRLRDVVGQVDPGVIRAVVLRSGKLGSFMNGVQLMLAGTVKSVDEAARLTAPVAEAYRALRTCPVPTVAAIRGNCYGCGVELTLQCRYRVASDERDTHFYMTELADYLLIPTFGSTQDLPRLLGLEGAVEFLLWGRRWPARRAFERGLVDGCFDPDAFDREVDAFVDGLPALGKKSAPRPTRRPMSGPELEEIQARTRARIRRLPPDYRDLYATCFDLMVEGATREGDAGYAREALEAARSALTPLSKAATPFFFVRQAAKSLAIAGSGDGERRAIAFEAGAPPLASLCAELAGRKGARIDGGLTLRMVPYLASGEARTVEGAAESEQVLVSDRVSDRPFDGQVGVVMHAPFRALGIDVVEVASAVDPTCPAEAALAAALVDRYFTVVRTRPRGRFVLDDLLWAWLMPQLEYVRAGGAAGDLAMSLRAFGFTRLPGDWVGALGADALCDLARGAACSHGDLRETLLALPSSSCDGGSEDPVVSHAVLASLGGFVARSLGDRSLGHVTSADVAARDVIDFPLRYTSLCRYLTPARSIDLLATEGTFRHLVSADNLSSFEEFAARGRPFYQGHARG